MKTTNLTKQEAIDAMNAGYDVCHESVNGRFRIKHDIIHLVHDNSISGGGTLFNTAPQKGFSIYQPEAKHTPLSNFIVCGEAKQLHEHDNWFVVIRKGDKDYFTIEGKTKEDAESTAAIIVKAVNNHDRLVTLLKSVEHELRLSSRVSHPSLISRIETTLKELEQ